MPELNVHLFLIKYICPVFASIEVLQRDLPASAEVSLRSIVTVCFLTRQGIDFGVSLLYKEHETKYKLNTE